MTVVGASFGWSWGGASTWWRPGSCDAGAYVAESGSPTTHPFALPRKRFVKQGVVGKAGEYLGTDHTYRKTVEEKGMPIMYDDRTPAGLEKASGLAWLGGMPETLQAAFGLIRQKEPNSTLHRQPWAVRPKKYRSEKRHQTLQQAMQLLTVDRMSEHLFGEGIFPRYATSRVGP